MHFRGFHRIFLHGLLVALLCWVCSSDQEYRCPYSIHVNKGQIIKAKESVRSGASFLKHASVRDARECYKLCCERKNCDLAQMQYKNTSVGYFREMQIEKICYMFHCGKPSKCRFGEHDHYATISYERPDEELSYLDGNQYQIPSVKVGQPKWGSKTEIKPSVPEGNGKDKDLGSQQNKPPSRQQIKVQEKYEEDKDLTTPWKQKSQEGSGENTKKLKGFGQDRYYIKVTKLPSKTVLDKEEHSKNSQEPEPPYYEVVSKNLETPTQSVHVQIKGPVIQPVEEVPEKRTEEQSPAPDSDDIDAELERKLEELTPNTGNWQHQPVGHGTKAVPTTVKPTFHHWRQFVDNNPNYPYTIPVEVQKPVQKPIQKPIQKPVERPVEKPVQKPTQQEWHKPTKEQRTTKKTTTTRPRVKTELPKTTERTMTTEEAKVFGDNKERQDEHPVIEVPIRSKNISDVVVIETHRLKIIENKAVLPLAIFLVIAILLLFVVALRLRIVKSRLKRRPFATDDADYLINGMYL